MKGNIAGGRTFNKVTGINILGSFSAFPEPLTFPNGKVFGDISNEDIFFMLMGEHYEKALASRNLTVDYPEKVIGLKHRRWTHIIGTPANHQEENTVDLGVKAVKGLLNKLNLTPDDIDLLIFSSTTPHKITSATSCAIAAETEIKAPCLDLKAGCTSSIYALLNTCLQVKAGFGKVLLVASETPSKYANPKVQETIMGVGDGAVAFLFEEDDSNRGILGGLLGADGELGKLVHTPGLVPPTHEAIEQGLYYYHGDANTLKEIVPIRYIDAMQQALKVSGLTPNDLDLYIPHQINRYLTQQVAKNLTIPEEKQYYNLHKHGNIAGAAILLAIHEALEEGRIKDGSKVALNAVGGGLTWGGLVWQF